MRAARIAPLLALVGAGLAAPPLPASDAAPAPVTWSYADAVRIALERSPILGQAAAEARAAAARVGQARSARLPQLAAAASVSESEIVSPATGEPLRDDAESVQATVAQLVTDLGRTRTGIERASRLAAAADEGGVAARVEVAHDAGVAYLGVLRAEAVVGGA